MKHEGTNWKPILFWGALILAVVIIFAFNLNRTWLFIIAMIACHLGHQSMMGGKHH